MSMRTAVPHRADGRSARLLVVDDETVLAELLTESLSFAGYDVHVARTGSQALAAVPQVQPDLILLDVNLPDFNGFAVAARLRTSGDQTPIMFLTARDAPADLRDGFGSGGDDYLTKPFRLEELRLRVEAVLRRTMGSHPGSGSVIEVADLVIDTDSRQARRGRQALPLSDLEFQLLLHLARNRNKVMSPTDLLRHVWKTDHGDAALVADQITALKAKVDAVKPALIHTVNSNGYILRVAKP
jgi:two-component system OmpR family response regulator